MPTDPEVLVALLAVERFTGRGITPDDFAQIQAAGVGFRITDPG
ncbi:hypothetical protein [Micromonospora sp. KC721]|nr:hypothetical protein [Micromonospora sp. KC721]